MQPLIKLLYAFSPEDRSLKRANKIGLVTYEGRVTPDLIQRCCQYQFKLNSKCREGILSIQMEELEVKTRIPLHIKISNQKIASEIREVAKKKFKVKILFIGGGLLKPLKPLMEDFFDQCGLKDILTALFKAKLVADPNDFDFQCIAPVEKIEDYKVLIDEGLVCPLANRVKWDWINPNLLTEQLKNYKNHSSTLSKDSYLSRVFEEHPEFNSNSKDLGEIAVKALGFSRAYDSISKKSENNESESGFYFRNIASATKSYDWFFPKNIPQINSLCVDISEIENEEAELYLESVLGKEMTLQAVMDANFAILYGDPNHSANELDFARTICNISKKGRWYGTEWLPKTLEALKEETKRRKLSLSVMLSPQLISRAYNHHRSPLQALIVMTFNASAILMAFNPELKDEIQKLWQEIGKHLKKIEKDHPKKPKDPLIAHIESLMCGSNCSFQDLLYREIQIHSFLCQHESKEGKGKYKCRPTESEGALYTQIVVNFSENCVEEESLDLCTLFFPYALSESIDYMKINPSISDHSSIHDLLTSGTSLTVGMSKSVLHKDKYRFDSRRNFSQCVQKAMSLFEIKNQHVWQMGFLLTLSHLAMNKDEKLLKALLKSLISMLLDCWPKDEFKLEISQLLQEMLKNSGIDIRAAFFQRPSINALIGDLLSSDENLLKDLGWEYFKKIENKPHDILEKLYFDLINSYFHSQKLGRNEDSFLIDLLKNMVNSKQLSIESSLKVCITLYKNIKVLRGVENDLLDVTLMCFENVTVLNGKVNSNVEKVLPTFVQTILQSKACELSPHIGLCLALEAHRLKIFVKEPSKIKNKFSEAVKTIHEIVINEPKIAPNYLSEKFDAMSDFMQHYCLQSVHSLKASISRRIKVISKLCCKPEDREVFLHLLSLLAKSQEAWDERLFIIETLKNLPLKELDHNIEKVLEIFYNIPSTRTNKEQVGFYLDQLKKEELQYAPCILQPLIILLCNEKMPLRIADDANQMEYCDQEYIECTEGVLRVNLHKGLSKFNRIEISEKFVLQLYHKKLWKELLCIYVADPQILVGWTTQSASIFINTYYHGITNPHICLNEEQKVRAYKLLKSLPLDLELSIEAKKNLGLLLHNYQNECMQRKDFLEALVWSEKLKFCDGLNEDGNDRDFELVAHLARQGEITKAKNLLNFLYQREGNPALWMELFKVLIKEDQMPRTLQLFHNHQCPPGKDQEAFIQQWLETIPELLSQCRELANFKDEKHQLQLQGIYELSHQVVCWCNPKENLWIEYIKLAVTSAPVGTLEKILDLLANVDKGSLHIPQYCRVFCWNLVLESLEKCVSTKFLHPLIWWPIMWKEVSNAPKAMKGLLVYRLINGSANAIYPLHPYEGGLLLDQQQSNDMICGIKEVLKILESDEVIKFLFPQEKMFTCMLRLDFAKLCWFSETPDRRSSAIRTLFDTYILMGDDPLVEHKAIFLFNTFLRTMPKCKTIRDIRSTLVLIQRVQESFGFLFADHFSILRFLKEALQKLKLEAKNNNQMDEELFKKIIGCIWCCINENVRAILCSSKDTNIESKEIDLVKWGIDELKNADIFLGAELAVWCAEKESISHYFDKKEIEEFRDYKVLPIGRLIIKIMLIYEGAKRCKNALTSPIERWNYLRSQGLVHYFQLQAGEKNAIGNAVEEGAAFLTKILVIMTLGYFILGISRK